MRGGFRHDRFERPRFLLTLTDLPLPLAWPSFVSTTNTVLAPLPLSTVSCRMAADIFFFFAVAFVCPSTVLATAVTTDILSPPPPPPGPPPLVPLPLPLDAGFVLRIFLLRASGELVAGAVNARARRRDGVGWFAATTGTAVRLPMPGTGAGSNSSVPPLVSHACCLKVPNVTRFEGSFSSSILTAAAASGVSSASTPPEAAAKVGASVLISSCNLTILVEDHGTVPLKKQYNVIPIAHTSACIPPNCAEPDETHSGAMNIRVPAELSNTSLPFSHMCATPKSANLHHCLENSRMFDGLISLCLWDYSRDCPNRVGRTMC